MKNKVYNHACVYSQGPELCELPVEKNVPQEGPVPTNLHNKGVKNSVFIYFSSVEICS